MTITRINTMTPADFIAAFGDIAEYSPWVARETASYRPFENREAMIKGFETALKAANRDAQLALIRAHPDLANKAKLTGDSTREQAGAGLDTLSTDEFARFTALNAAYRARFGFPFIFAVKGATKHMIFDAFETRVDNAMDEELATAIAQICRIFRFRIEDRVSP
jgi:2-oxo-4-hydroxy-4-carboxy-5-ureidoimidazoline decarboxylase